MRWRILEKNEREWENFKVNKVDCWNKKKIIQKNSDGRNINRKNLKFKLR